MTLLKNAPDYSHMSTREVLELATSGKAPLKKIDPITGKESYYFLKMQDDYGATLSDAETIDVPDGVDPYEFMNNNYQDPNTLSNPYLSSGINNPYLSGTSVLGNTDNTSVFGNTANNSIFGGTDNNSYLSTTNNESLFGQPSNTNILSTFPTANLTLNQMDNLIGMLSKMLGISEAQAATLTENGIDNSGLDIRADIDRHFPALKELEGTIPFIYYDSEGIKTTGIGARITEDGIRNNEYWDLTPEQQELTTHRLKVVQPMARRLGQLTTKKQKDIFDVILKTSSPHESTDPFISSLSQEQLEAFKHLYSLHISDDKMKNFVYKHFEKDKPKLIEYLNTHGLDWNSLPLRARDIILDRLYNTGPEGLKKFVNLAKAIKAEDYLLASEHTHTTQVSPRRNNYSKLRILPELEHLSPLELYRIIDRIGDVELVADNFDSYKHLFNLSDNPLRRR